MKEIKVAKKDELKPGQMKAVSLDAEKRCLLANVDGEFHAVGCCCTHYGAPLAEGLLSGDKVICPWHSAEFSVRNGDVCEPPALDPLPRYSVRIEGNDVFVSLPEEPEVRRAPAMVAADPRKDHRTFAILGAGAAGSAAAQTLRECGYQGRIVMITRENHLPYDRPNLSKGYLEGKAEPEWMLLREESFYAEWDIEVMRSIEVTRVDSPLHRLEFADGRSLPYDKLLLATGSTPRSLSVPGSKLGNLFTLRTREDADAIVAACASARRVLVLGASFIGIETAHSLSSRGLNVTVAAPESLPFESKLGPELGSLVRETHNKAGITFQLGRKVERFNGNGTVETAVLDNGAAISADVVIAGIGVDPVTPVLEGISRESDGSIRVNAHFEAARDVYAAGDIAMFPHGRTGVRMRTEHWRAALQQGQVAARNMSGRPAVYEGVPFFWTKQGGLNIKYLGYAPKWDEKIVHGDTAAGAALVFYGRNGILAAVAGVGMDNQIMAIQAIMQRGTMPNLTELRRREFDFIEQTQK